MVQCKVNGTWEDNIQLHDAGPRFLSALVGLNPQNQPERPALTNDRTPSSAFPTSSDGLSVA